jgi:hypothetical protein
LEGIRINHVNYSLLENDGQTFPFVSSRLKEIKESRAAAWVGAIDTELNTTQPNPP